MSEPSLVDQLWSLFNPSDSMNHDYEKAGRWVIGNYSRILAALRGNEEDARIARIVRSVGTDDEGGPFAVDIAVESREAFTYDAVLVCTAILALVNEAGERERQG